MIDGEATKLAKDCPFCGGMARVCSTASGKWRVECELCGATSWRGNAKPEQALAMWNRREHG